MLAHQPGNDGALAILVTSSLAKGDLSAAQQAANELEQRLPTAGSLSLGALAAAASGRDEEAVEGFERAIALEEVGDAYGSAWLRTQLGKLRARHGQNAEAEALYR